jgi:hypothetical protein
MEDYLSYYEKNWHKLLYEPESKDYGEFCKTVTYERAKHYYEGDACENDSFEAHCYDGMENRADFKLFWTANASNLDRLKDYKRKPSMVDTDIFRFLQGHISKYNQYTIEACDLKSVIPSIYLNQHDTIQKVSTLLNVKTYRDYFYLWGYFYNIQKYDIYQDEFLGSVYVKIRSNEKARTIPIAPKESKVKAKSLVISDGSFNLPHEFTHGIQFCLNNFYDIETDYVETPAIIVERIFRRENNASYDDNFMRRQLAVAMADLSSETPEEFNANYEKIGNIKNAFNVASRFWHYRLYDKKYYSYIYGLLSDEEPDVAIRKLKFD